MTALDPGDVAALTEEDEQLVEVALNAADAGNAGHWPTVAGYLADEVRRLRLRTAAAYAEGYEAGRGGVTAAVEALADDLWRVAPCGCGHRADLHTVGALDPSVCTGGLGLCGCDWSYTRIIQTRLRAVLAAAPTLATVRADAGRDALNAAADWMEAHFTHGSGWTGERVAYLLRARAEAVGDDRA